MTQAETNPYPHSNSNKRYQTYDYYLKHTFGAKVVKLPLNGGFSCPNLDGTCGVGGCIYCSERGSGDFAPEASLSIAEQIARQKTVYAKKWDVSRCIAYFQARTNTYGSVELMRSKFEEALAQEGIVGLNIATRPDCLPPEVLSLLAELAEKTVLTVELGLQSSNDETAHRINRGHTFAQFCEGVAALRAASPRIGICAHLILGLPGEGRAEMLKTVEDVATLEIPQVKLHLLHVLRGTALADQYLLGDYRPLDREEYISLLADAIERLPINTVICRLTGDGKSEDLLAPLWSQRKTTVVNDLDKLLYARGSYQGCRCASKKED